MYWSIQPMENLERFCLNSGHIVMLHELSSGELHCPRCGENNVGRLVQFADRHRPIQRYSGSQEQRVLPYDRAITSKEAIHILRDPAGWHEDSVRRARLYAAEVLEQVWRLTNE